ncbi:MAG TPA: hypothetical protein VMR98_04650, partial [Candidatus Polarisedimenticolaceae bacterium]|nr:hypothetical protein [Candidatus Polarisedimenticolaceae bacterium]
MMVPAAASAASATVGMPFTGKWAYNVPVSPPYTDNNSSHPSVHHSPGAGDWAIDLYAAEGTPVKLYASSSDGAVSYGWKASSSCGTSSMLNVFVNGSQVGTVYYAHLANAVKSGPITNGMTLGTVHNWGSSCNPGPHTHVEFKNTAGAYSCYTDHGSPGVTVSEGAALGVLGSTNSGPRQACAPGSLNSSYADGTYLGSIEGYGVYRMAGGVPIKLTNWGILPGCCGNVQMVHQSVIDSFGGFPANGTFIAGAEPGGGVYRIAGGAPIKLTNWGAVPGCCSNVIFVNQGSIDSFSHMRSVPLDGTYIAGSEPGGGIYRIAGAAPIKLTNWGILPECCSNVVFVNQSSIDGLSRMSAIPSDGTFIGGAEPGGGVYKIVGGAPIRLTNWGIVPGCCSNVIMVNQGSIDNLDHMRSVPIDGTFISGIESGSAVYRMAGGAPLKLTNWGAVPGCCGNVNFVNQGS